MRAIIVGLQSSQIQLQSVLISPNFVPPRGRNRDIRLLLTDARLGKAVLIQIKPTAARYKFVPVQTEGRSKNIR